MVYKTFKKKVSRGQLRKASSRCHVLSHSFAYDKINSSDNAVFCGRNVSELENKMEEARSVVSLALAERTKHQIKVKQPLLQLTIKNEKLKIKASSELLGLIKDEVNVREIIFNSGIENEVELDLNITGELKEEGIVREIVRNIQGMRKQAGLTPEDRISVSITGDDYLVEIIKKNEKILLKEFRAAEIIFSNTNFKEEKEVLIDSKNALFKIKKK